jgi:hypothetical protein
VYSETNGLFISPNQNIKKNNVETTLHDQKLVNT